MRQIVALPGQSLFDVALQYCGDISFAFDIAKFNNLNIADTIEEVVSLSIPDDSNNIAAFFKNESIIISCGILTVVNAEWLMSNGTWNDDAFWNDNAVWND